MIIRIDPPLPIFTPKGSAVAHFLIDNGMEFDLNWVCFQDDTGECWTWRNRYIRAQKNITEGREHISPFYDPEDVAFIKKDVKLPLITSDFLSIRCSICNFLHLIEKGKENAWRCYNCNNLSAKL
jgi:hypothetical protein